MIRHGHRHGSGPGYRRRMGSAGSAISAASGATALETAGIGAAVSIATSAVGDWINSIQLSHDADTATTLIVNGLAAQLANLDAAYLADPTPSCAAQRAALDAYDQAWQWLQSSAACGNPTYGQAGNACITDRAPGGKYPWATYYRAPIANDPRVSSCDTSDEVLLPSLSTGTYAASGITAAGQADNTTAASTAAAPSTASASATSTTAPATVSTGMLLAAATLIALFMVIE